MYLYIFEDGDIQKHEGGPTDTDIDMVNDGCLVVIDCETCVVVDGDFNWHHLDECDIENENGDSFHVPS